MAKEKVGRGNYGTQTTRGRAQDAMEQVIKDIGKKGKSEGHRAPLALGQEIAITGSKLPNKRTKFPNVFTATETATPSRFNKSKTYGKARNMGGTMNYDVGGTAEEHKAAKTSSATQEVTRKQFKKALKDLTEAVDEDNKKSKQYLKDNVTTPIKIKATRLLTKVLGKSKEIVTGERGPGSGKSSNPQRPSSTRNMGGTMKNYRDGGIEAADKEGSRLSISMERQEDAGYSPSEADFDQQNRLAAEGIMEVGADVKIIQGHNSRASLGETEGVRGTGAMVKGTKFRGSF